MATLDSRTPHVRSVRSGDIPTIIEIYNHYVVNTVVTFEEDEVGAHEVERRIAIIEAADLPWLVASQGGMVVGYAYADRWRTRHAYRFSVEVTVYIAPEHSRRGVGSALYASLLDDLSERGFHTALGVVALPNPASVALHHRFGFEKVGHLQQVGFKFDRWIDVGYWQRRL